MTTAKILSAFFAAALLAAAPAFAAGTPAFPPNPVPLAPAAIASHINVVSDKVEDISSLEAWKKSFIKPGMTEQQKALAVWTTVVKFRQQTAPSREFLEDDGDVHDPIKDFNVYGYDMCDGASAAVEALARYAGLQARGWGINNHSVPEVKIDGHWALLDGSLIDYFQKPDGQICGVEEINKSITDWLHDHPEYQSFNNHQQYYKIMRNGQWKKIGPTVLSYSATYDNNGWQPAHTHAWGDSIFEFGGTAVPIKDAHKPFLFEYGTALGYQVNIQLRPGEKLIRNWSNKGLDVNELESHHPADIDSDSPDNPHGDMAYAPKYGDLTHSRVGNGTLEYNPPLDSLKDTALTYDNLTVTNNTLHAKDPAKPATVIIRMPSSYVYLSGQLELHSLGTVKVSFSDNNGLDWKPLTGGEQNRLGITIFDFKSLVYRRYDYRLKFELNGPSASISAVKITHDIQESQRALPALDTGDNHITFSEGPQEGTITVQGNLPENGSNPAAAKNLLFSEFHPVLDNVEPSDFRLQKSAGSVTIPVKTPGDITRIRLGAFYRAVTAADKWTAEVSFDNGKTFTPFLTLAGPNRGNSEYTVFDKIPPHTRSALVLFAGHAHAPDNLWFQDLRIDADYLEPHGGFAPVKITYAWEENGKPKTDIHIAKSLNETYIIHCAAKPTMKSITLELAS